MPLMARSPLRRSWLNCPRICDWLIPAIPILGLRMYVFRAIVTLTMVSAHLSFRGMYFCRSVSNRIRFLLRSFPPARRHHCRNKAACVPSCDVGLLYCWIQESPFSSLPTIGRCTDPMWEFRQHQIRPYCVPAAAGRSAWPATSSGVTQYRSPSRRSPAICIRSWLPMASISLTAAAT